MKETRVLDMELGAFFSEPRDDGGSIDHNLPPYPTYSETSMERELVQSSKDSLAVHQFINILNAKQNNPSQPVSITQHHQSNTIELHNSDDYNHVRVNKSHDAPLREKKKKFRKRNIPSQVLASTIEPFGGITLFNTFDVLNPVRTDLGTKIVESDDSDDCYRSDSRTSDETSERAIGTNRLTDQRKPMRIGDIFFEHPSQLVSSDSEPEGCPTKKQKYPDKKLFLKTSISNTQNK